MSTPPAQKSTYALSTNTKLLIASVLIILVGGISTSILLSVKKYNKTKI